MRLPVTWLLVLLGACTPALPSTEPLGRGPLAEQQEEDELPDRPRANASGAEAKDGGTDVGADADLADAAEPTDGEAADAGDAGDAGDGAGGEGPGDAGAASFVGEYVGTDVTTFRWEGEPEEKSPDPKARVRIESTSDTEVTIIVIYTPTGTPFCSLSATVSGNRAEVAPDQTCPDSELNLGFSAVVTSGKATLDGDRLVLEVEGDAELPAGNDTRVGDFEYRFEGTR